MKIYPDLHTFTKTVRGFHLSFCYFCWEHRVVVAHAQGRPGFEGLRLFLLGAHGGGSTCPGEARVRRVKTNFEKLWISVHLYFPTFQVEVAREVKTDCPRKEHLEKPERISISDLIDPANINVSVLFRCSVSAPLKRPGGGGAPPIWPRLSDELEYWDYIRKCRACQM
jgi:hypothetical protein